MSDSNHILPIVLDSSEIVQFPSHFSGFVYERVLGTGRHSFVILAFNVKMHSYYACKVFVKSQLKSENETQLVSNEIEILKRVDHPNIIKILNVIELTDFIILVMPYYPGGQLLQHLGLINLSEEMIIKYLYQISSALAYLNKNGIAHRDVKAENIVLDSKGNAILIDLGLAESSNIEHCSTFCGTSYYLAPEVIKGEEYDARKSDVWSLGILLYAMLTQSFPYDDENINIILSQMHSLPYLIETQVQSKLSKLLFQMLSEDPSLRPFPSDIVDHLNKFFGMDKFVAQFEDRKTNIPCKIPIHLHTSAKLILPKKAMKKNKIIRPYLSQGTCFMKCPIN